MKRMMLGVAVLSMVMWRVASAGGTAGGAGVVGADVVGADVVRMDDGDDARANTGFRASGVHNCYAGSNIQHTCKVAGEGFSTCAKAQAVLEADDCCPRSPEGGKSVELTSFVCSPL